MFEKSSWHNDDYRYEFSWRCDRLKFQEIVLAGDTYRVDVMEWHETKWTVIIDVIPIEKEYPVFATKEDNCVVETVKYCKSIWQFQLARSSSVSNFEVISWLLFGPDCGTRDLDFSAGVSSLMIGEMDTEKMVSSEFVLLLNFGYKFPACIQPIEFSSLPELSQNMSDYHRQESLTDVVIKCKSQVVKAHRSILCARSDKFKEILNVEDSKKGDAVAPEENGVLEVEITDVEPEVLRAMVAFIYCGEIEVTSESMADALERAADLYNIQSLSEGVKELKE